MPLQFTCPECDANLKLANEALAGKKIKCPKCAAVVTVPLRSAPDEEDALEETPPAKKQAQPRADDDFAGNDRPRREKGKKKSAAFLYLGIAGAAVLLIGVAVTLFLVLSGKGDPKEQMLGVWKLDLAETKNINPKFEPPSGEMALEFRKDGVLLMKTGKRSEDGTWKLIKENGQQLTLEVGGAHDAKKDVVTLTVLSSAKIKVTLPEGTGEAVLVRGEAPAVAGTPDGDKKGGGSGMSKEEARARINSINNVMQLALAMHGFHDGVRKYPPADGSSPSVKSKLTGFSWRVYVAPFVEQDKIYSDLLNGRLKSDDPAEPWNIAALKNMPALPFTREDHGKDRWLTPYRAFIGPGTAFEKGKSITLGSGFPDGLSNTIVLVETAEMVPWTKPDELIYDPAGPLPKLGGIWPDGFYAGFADGMCRFIPNTTDEKTLRALITRNGGENIPPLPNIDIRALRKIAELKDPFSRDD